MTNTTNPPISDNLTQFIVECQENMLSNGILCDEELILDDERHRFSGDSNQRKKDEWYVGGVEFTEEGEKWSCTYGSWSTGQKNTFSKIYTSDSVRSTDELEELKSYISSKKQKRQASVIRKKKKKLRALFNASRS